MGSPATSERHEGRSGRVPSTLTRCGPLALTLRGPLALTLCTLSPALCALSLALGLLLPAPALASYTRVIERFPVCIAAGSQTYSAISGDIVVWEDSRNGTNNPDIYGYDLATKTEFPICTAAGVQGCPAISGDIVVWQDFRSGTDNPDVYGYDLATKTAFPICTAAGNQGMGAISGDIVVWQDNRNDTDTHDDSPNWDIYGYDLATHTEFPICTAPWAQQDPQISGDIVVWCDGRSGADIYGYDLATKAEFPVCTAAEAQVYPAISGDTVVWADFRNVDPDAPLPPPLDAYDIYGYDLATRTEFPVCTAPGQQDMPAVSGGTVAWPDKRSGNWDIYGYDLATKAQFPICTAPGDQALPAISGDTVVWHDMRNGNYDIYGARLAPAVTGYVYDGHGEEGQQEHAVQDARVEVREAGSEAVLDTAHTDEKGKFELSFAWQAGTTYRATVTLESEDGLLVMKRDGDLVSFARDFSDPSPDAEGLEIDCSQAGELAEASMDKDDVENCASVWHYLGLNRQTAQELDRDLTETLTVNVFASEKDGTAAFYRQNENAVYLGAHVVDDDTHAGTPADAEPAPWQFRKNRETHEFGHSLMNALMGGAWVARPDLANHAGYANQNTGDSLAEGFAEFWAMVVDESAAITGAPECYDEWGYLAGAQRRMAWAPVNPAAPLAEPTDFPDEELAAAGLLRSLQGVLGGGEAGFLAIADRLPAGGTLTDLRDALVSGGAAPDAVDPVFYAYGFFADADGDWTRDAGEGVGAGNGSSCKLLWDAGVGPVTVLARPDREDHPYDPNSFLVVDLPGVRDAAQESWVTVHVKHAGEPAADYAQRTLVTGASGLLFVTLDAGATSAVITATGPDGEASADRLTFTAAEWKAARSAAVDDVALTETFRVNRVTLGNPVAPRTMSPARRYTVTATLKPRHAAGSFPLRIYKYRYVAGKWRSYGYVKAKASDYGTFTRCSCKVKLPIKGTWRLRALAPADTYHKATWSRGYDYVTVR